MEKSSKLQVIGLAVAGLGMAVTTQTMAAAPKISGLIQADYAAFRGKPQDGFLDSSTIRRADLGVSGDVNQFWGYNVVYRYSSGQLRNAYVSYNAFKPLTVHFGQYDTVYSGLEYSSGSTQRLFISDSAVNAVWNNSVPVWGVRGMGSTGMFSYQVGAWTPGSQATSSLGTQVLTGSTNQSLSGRDPWGFSARVAFAPVARERAAVHVGLSYYVQGLTNNGTTVQYQPIQVRNTPALIQDTDYFKRVAVWGLEGLAIWGPFYGQAEYMRGTYKAFVNPSVVPLSTNPTSRHHDGWYAQFAYLITGESHGYATNIGGVTNPKPHSQFGAWEVGLRYDTFNMRQQGQTLDGTKYGDVWPNYTSATSATTFAAAPGIVRDWTAGVTYYATQTVKFQLNYTDAHAAFLAPVANKRVRFWAFRGQVQF